MQSRHRVIFAAFTSAILGAWIDVVPYAADASIACSQPRLVPFATGNVISGTQPTIRWEAVEGATRYRVQLDSRIPEGRRILLVDTYTSATEFTPPQPLTDFRARITVLVTPECGAGAGAASQPLRFEIDTSARCVLLAENVKRDGNDLVWSPVDGMVSYQVSAYGEPSGKLMGRQELRQERIALASLNENATALSVRPRCRAGWGEAVYVPLVRGPMKRSR